MRYTQPDLRDGGQITTGKCSLAPVRTFSEDCNTMKKLTYLSASTAGKSYVTNKEVPELDNLILRTNLFFPRNDKGKKKART